jgi:hypothetical protein
VLRRRRPNTIQRGGVPTSMESCGGTLVPRVNSHTARLAPPEFYSVTRTNKQFSQAFQPFPGLTHIRTVAAGTAQIASPRPLILIYFFRLIPLLGVSFNCRWVRVGCEFQLPFFAKFSDATQARAGRKRTRSCSTIARRPASFPTNVASRRKRSVTRTISFAIAPSGKRNTIIPG